MAMSGEAMATVVNSKAANTSAIVGGVLGALVIGGGVAVAILYLHTLTTSSAQGGSSYSCAQSFQSQSLGGSGSLKNMFKSA